MPMGFFPFTDLTDNQTIPRRQFADELAEISQPSKRTKRVRIDKPKIETVRINTAKIGLVWINRHRLKRLSQYGWI